MKIFKFIKNNLLLTISLFLLAFIPLYPKFPLFGVSHTWVYIRLEDFLIASSILIWIIYAIRKKITIKTPLTLPIIIFWLIGAVSTFNAIYFIFPNIPNVFPTVALFHLIRRVEYLWLFFIGFSAIKDKKHINKIIIVLALTLVAVVLYGVGQRYLGFPAYLTMNEEFAKGIPLRLSPLARIPSTFAGHYDLAAYLILIIPLMGSLIFGFKKIYLKLLLFFVSVSGLTLLLMTSSRVSFMVYLLAVSLMLFIHKQKKYIIPVVILSILFMNMFQGMSQRFASTISQVDLVVDARTGKAVGIATNAEDAKNKKKPIIIKEDQSTGENLPQGSGFINLPSGSSEKTITKVVYERTKIKEGTESTEVTDIEGDFIIKKALAYDVSFTTRFQGEWPRAVEAFKRNIFIGSGYSSISLATDNNYLRILGEIGILGFLSFAAIFIIAGIYVKALLKNVDSPVTRAFVIGIMAGTFALILNATLIDVFEASKVAFSFWLLLGLTLGILKLYQKKKVNYLKGLIEIVTSIPAIIIYLFLVSSAIFASSINNFFVGDDFTWLRWAADCKKILYTSGTVACDTTKSAIAGYFANADGFFYRPGTKTYFYYMYGMFWLNPIAYHVFSITFHFINASLVFILSKKILKNKFFAFIAALFFVVLAVHAESVFWISATGHLISSLFILLALIFYIFGKEKKNFFLYIFSFLSIIISLLFHEMGIVAPFLILGYALITNEKIFSKDNLKNLYTLIFFIPIPFYLYLRGIANSHWFSGDYNYNLSHLPYNIFGNLFGYFGISLLGANFLNTYEALRDYGKQNTAIVVLVIFVFIILIYVLCKFTKKHFNTKELKTIYISLAIFVITLIPFLGLGNITARYAYLSSIGVLLLFSFFLKKGYFALEKVNKLLAIIVIGAIIIFYTLFNSLGLLKINNDWERAGNITRSLLAGFNETFVKTQKVTDNPVFYFVDVPIKTGEAWVFPVGLPDAMWFTFQNVYLTVHTSPNLDLALDQAEGSQSARVFQFDNKGGVEEVVRKTKEVPVPAK